MKTVQELAAKINKIAIYIDLIDQEINEIKDNEIKHNTKLWCNNVRKATKRFIKECDSILKSENQEAFGITSDKLRIIIDDLIGLTK